MRAVEHQQAAGETGQHGALPGQTGPLVLQSGIPGRECHPKPTMISATIPTPATIAVRTRSSGEDGSGSLSRIARSLPIHLLNAPIPQASPQMTRTAEASRISRPSRSVRCATAAIATPAARKPSPVRIQARKVRSLAKVNRGSGSEPAAYTRRGQRRSRCCVGALTLAMLVPIVGVVASRRFGRLAKHHGNEDEERAQHLPVIEALVE